MAETIGTSTQMEREVRARLARMGARMTPGRREVVSALQHVRGPESAAELHERLQRSVPLSSLYRTLAVLEECGVVEPHHGPVTRYELAEWLRGHHHHLVCSECGRVEDVELDKAGEARLAALAEGVAEAVGFASTGHSLEIEGLCEECRS